MSRDVNAVIRCLLALTGADPRKARLPLGKRKVRAPEGNDVTEDHQAGGDMRAWVMAVMDDDVRFLLATTLDWNLCYA